MLKPLSYSLWLSLLALAAIAASVQTIPPTAVAHQAAGLSTLPPAASLVRDAYQREFGEVVPIPTIFNDERSVDCRHNGHLMTTAYVRKGGNRSTLMEMYLSRDGTQVLSKRTSSVMTPTGTFKTLVIIVRYSATVDAAGIDFFIKAQKQINEDHAAFARKRGYKAPLVVFDNTNLIVEPEEFDGVYQPLKARAIAMRKGVAPDDYAFVILIDPNPVHFAGGLSIPGNGDIYVGNYGHWTTTVDEREWIGIARTVYHHEVAHHWGWAHDWSPTCGGTKLGFEPFLAAPILFGWEDVDGDGVPEILDDTPYGRDRDN